MDFLLTGRHHRFLVVGRAGMDFYPDPPGTRIEAAERFVSCLGGSAANISVALTRQGQHATLVTRVSDDAIGRYCSNQLAHYGVAIDHVAAVGGQARNSLAVVESRIEDNQSVIYRNGAADFELCQSDIDAIDFSSFDAVITAGTVFAAEPSRSASFSCLERAKRAGLPVIFDIDYRPYSWPSPQIAADVYSRASQFCDLVVGNDVEFGFMAGGYETGLGMARELAQREGRIVIYKMGEKGAITITAGGEINTGIYSVAALKPTGAGDAFMGGFVAGLVGGHSLEQSVLRGAASAAIVVARVGCAPAMPTTLELDEFMSLHSAPATIPA